MHKNKAELTSYVIGLDPGSGEYGVSYNETALVAYYGPKIKDNVVIEKLVAKELGIDYLKYIDGYWGSRGGIAMSVKVVKDDYISSKKKYLITWNGTELEIISNAANEIKELEEKLKAEADLEIAKKQIELYDKLSADEKKEIIMRIAKGELK